jgi:hypothetical protein
MANESTERAVSSPATSGTNALWHWCQKFIRQAFKSAFPVFALTKKHTGGEGWGFIRGEIKKRLVVLSLLSDESSDREWINYQAGGGDGSGARVVPIDIKGYTFDKLDFPLKGFQGRYPTDLEGILLDISQQTGKVSGAVDVPAYLAELRQAEDSLIYKNLIFLPIRAESSGHPDLVFELQNQGNVDIDLLFAEVWVPQSLIQPNWGASHYNCPPMMEIDTEVHGYWHVRHFSSPGTRDFISRLEPVITRSMGVRRIRDLRFRLKGQYTNDEEHQVVRYQIHARDYDTSPEETPFKDIEIKG